MMAGVGYVGFSGHVNENACARSACAPVCVGARVERYWLINPTTLHQGAGFSYESG